MNGGWESEVWSFSHGIPSTFLSFSDVSTINKNATTLYQLIADSFANGYVVSANCMAANPWVVSGHAYSVLGAYKINDA